MIVDNRTNNNTAGIGVAEKKSSEFDEIIQTMNLNLNILEKSVLETSEKVAIIKDFRSNACQDLGPNNVQLMAPPSVIDSFGKIIDRIQKISETSEETVSALNKLV